MKLAFLVVLLHINVHINVHLYWGTECKMHCHSVNKVQTVSAQQHGSLLCLTMSLICKWFSRLFFICFLFQSNFFDEYRIEGKDETNNIYLELMPENLTRAMKSAASAQAVKIKLAKKHTPCLTFEITLVSSMIHWQLVVYDHRPNNKFCYKLKC